jgi:polyisoprenoid-binding protein YceI
MKRILQHIILALTLSLPFSVSAFAADTYMLDPNHTYVLWHINHFGFSNPSGKWFANGTIVLDEAQPQNSKLNVMIDIADIDTGIKDLDDHLKSPLFFDASKYPIATFVSTKVNVTGKNTATVTGMLMLHGVTKPVTLAVTLNKIGISPLTDLKTVGFSATATINRSDFNINTLIPEISDEVKIDIEAEGSLENQ